MRWTKRLSENIKRGIEKLAECAGSQSDTYFN